MMTNNKTKENPDFLWHTYEAISEWVKFSDVKAGTIVAIQAVIWGFVGSNVGEVKTAINCVGPIWATLLTLIFFVVSGLSIFFAILSVHPTMRVGESHSHIYFAHIGQRVHKSKTPDVTEEVRERFVKEILSLDTVQQSNEIAQQIWANGRVAWKKYNLVSVSMWFLYGTLVLFVGGMLALIL